MRSLLAPCLVALVALAGCAPRPALDAPTATLPDAFPNHTAAQIRALMASSVADVATFSTESRASLESASRSLSFGVSLRARLTDSITVAGRGPLGIDALRGLVTPDSFLAHDKLNNRLYYGPLAAAERYVPGAVSSEALGRALVGLLVPDDRADWTVTADSAYYVLAAPTEGGGATRQTWTVDPRTWRPVRIVEAAADGSVVVERRYSEFGAVGGVAVPQRVDLTNPAEGVTVTVTHQRIALNPDGLRLRFDRPRDAQPYPVD